MPEVAFKGDVTTLGGADAIRFEARLFRQHPEFRQTSAVEGHVIGPGTLLVRVIPNEVNEPETLHEDAVLGAFLAFLEGDMARDPRAIQPLSAGAIAAGVALTQGMDVADDEVIPEGVTL